MDKKIKNFAEQNLVFWAILMGFISTFILFFGEMLVHKDNNNNGNYFEDNLAIFEFAKMIFYFLVLNLFFKLFSLTKTLGILFRITNTILLIILFFIIYMYSFENMEYLNQKINFLPVIEWTNNGYEPPEKEISSIFCWYLFMCLSFINIVLLNLLPVKILQNKKLQVYSSVIILVVIITSIIFLLSLNK
ncbi:hypothetical protein NZ698_16285 [Chryseobacterium sp. PBS4-4]|uniref:Uncharacterized protein n=1 Tax=Chryseobacterium edaphi TaxID=2976532 RepID=A0ABT2WDR8_9FLAO|nr:hypothetical protein [Chryseobacterium edaphi]MCU7618755.1 hypothetical protein [Chryseobacterium edaphi]